jgi:hypothetical protein
MIEPLSGAISNMGRPDDRTRIDPMAACRRDEGIAMPDVPAYAPMKTIRHQPASRAARICPNPLLSVDPKGRGL